MKTGYHNTIIDVRTGKGKLAFITVFAAGTNNKSTIYSDPGGSSKDNPFQTDKYGRFSFFADSGTYDIEVSGIGIVTYKLEGISIIGMQVIGMSSPSAGKCKVVNVYYDPDVKRFIAEYDDIPV